MTGGSPVTTIYTFGPMGRNDANPCIVVTGLPPVMLLLNQEGIFRDFFISLSPRLGT